ncbi:hypothetical protein RN001_003534 [Aquatica leii]|uniref:Uncharacterized protein n=1 Tax=Aquatica leii TaxID=1421715 RepID=A0AAN7SRM2_9COLE|nr:hypothetical protein RN001_003534 [Aquatica leii]
MNRSFEKKKESGAAGRKRRSLETKEKEKSSKVFKTFFQKSSTSTTSSDNPENSASAKPQELEELVAASIDGDPENFSYNSKILATSEETEVGPEFDKEMKIDDVEDKDLISENVQIIKCPIPKIIEEDDIGFLMFSEETGKAIISDPLRIEIIKHGFKHFQNIEGPFLPTNNRSMNKTWFFKKLGNSHDNSLSEQDCDLLQSRGNSHTVVKTPILLNQHQKFSRAWMLLKSLNSLISEEGNARYDAKLRQSNQLKMAWENDKNVIVVEQDQATDNSTNGVEAQTNIDDNPEIADYESFVNQNKLISTDLTLDSIPITNINNLENVVNCEIEIMDVVMVDSSIPTSGNSHSNDLNNTLLNNNNVLTAANVILPIAIVY